MKRFVLALTFASPLAAQSASIRVNMPTSWAPDTVYMAQGDTIPLRLVGRTVLGATVTPSSPSWQWLSHCGQVDNPKAIDVKFTELACGLAPGYLLATGIVNGVVVKDSVYVARPSFTLGSVLGICLSTIAGNPALRYVARDSALVLALQLESGAFAVTDGPANGIPDSGLVSFGWQIGSKQIPFRAIACVPGYRGGDVTTSTMTTWTTDNTQIASVARGLVTWKSARGFRLLATWRGWSSSWEVR